MASWERQTEREMCTYPGLRVSPVPPVKSRSALLLSVTHPLLQMREDARGKLLPLLAPAIQSLRRPKISMYQSSLQQEVINHTVTLRSLVVSLSTAE